MIVVVVILASRVGIGRIMYNDEDVPMNLDSRAVLVSFYFVRLVACRGECSWLGAACTRERLRPAVVKSTVADWIQVVSHLVWPVLIRVYSVGLGQVFFGLWVKFFLLDQILNQISRLIPST